MASQMSVSLTGVCPQHQGYAGSLRSFLRPNSEMRSLACRAERLDALQKLTASVDVHDFYAITATTVPAARARNLHMTGEGERWRGI